MPRDTRPEDRKLATTGTARRFSRFRTEAGNDPGLQPLPNDGLCLSAFLIVRDPAIPGSALWGRPDFRADWGQIGALDPSRSGRLRDRWMIPSCHLQLFESPSEAASRIADEQLGVPGLQIGAPRVFSEAYGRADDPANDPHWDLHFVFDVEWPKGRPVHARPWLELRFAAVDDLPPGSVARGHEDIVRLAGGP